MFEVSNEFTVNGDKSVKITKLSDSTSFIMFGSNCFKCNPNTHYTASLNIKLINSKCRLNFMSLNSSKSEIHRVILDLSRSDGYSSQISINTTEDTEYIRLLISYYGNEGGVIYLDNFSIKSG